MGPEVLGPLIPVVAILAYAGIKIARIVTQARPPAQDPEAAAQIAALQDEVGALRRELDDVHERLDFTERLLARQHTDRLGPPT
jgi:hypothetical protein